MNLTIAQVRADASPLSINLAFADLTTWAAGQAIKQGTKRMLAKFADRYARQNYPFVPDHLKFVVTQPPVLQQPYGRAHFGFQLQISNYTHYEVIGYVLTWELNIGPQHFFRFDKPIWVKLKENETMNFQLDTYLTPGLVKSLENFLSPNSEVHECELRFTLPVEHLLGKQTVTQRVMTTLRGYE